MTPKALTATLQVTDKKVSQIVPLMLLRWTGRRAKQLFQERGQVQLQLKSLESLFFYIQQYGHATAQVGVPAHSQWTKCTQTFICKNYSLHH